MLIAPWRVASPIFSACSDVNPKRGITSTQTAFGTTSNISPRDRWVVDGETRRARWSTASSLGAHRPSNAAAPKPVRLVGVCDGPSSSSSTAHRGSTRRLPPSGMACRCNGAQFTSTTPVYRRASGAVRAQQMPSSGCTKSSSEGSKPRPFCRPPDQVASLRLRLGGIRQLKFGGVFGGEEVSQR